MSALFNLIILKLNTKSAVKGLYSKYKCIRHTHTLQFNKNAVRCKGMVFSMNFPSGKNTTELSCFEFSTLEICFKINLCYLLYIFYFRATVSAEALWDI